MPASWQAFVPQDVQSPTEMTSSAHWKPVAQLEKIERSQAGSQLPPLEVVAQKPVPRPVPNWTAFAGRLQAATPKGPFEGSQLAHQGGFGAA